jgi:large subunit ribosomal protein L29
MKASDYRQMDEAEIEEALVERRRELLESRCKISLGEDVQAHHLKSAKQDIARMLTVLNEKKREGVEA